MKKTLLTAMLAALLVFPLEGIAQAETVEASLPETEISQQVEFNPGEVPAETAALDSVTPAIHGVVLAMLNHETDHLSLADPTLGWESLYNMLSLYGQMDDRAEYSEEELTLPSEIVMDFSAALAVELGELPADLADRMVYEADTDCYHLVCGDAGLAQIQLDSPTTADGALEVTGTLVYLVDGSDLARFQATLVPTDSLFGYTLTALELL